MPTAILNGLTMRRIATVDLGDNPAPFP